MKSLILAFSLISSASARASEPLPHQLLIGQYTLQSARCGSREIVTSDYETQLEVDREQLRFITARYVNGLFGTLLCHTIQTATILPEKSSASLLVLASIENRNRCIDSEGNVVSDHTDAIEGDAAGVLAYTHDEPNLRLIYLNAHEAPCPGTKDGLELNFARNPLPKEAQ